MRAIQARAAIAAVLAVVLLGAGSAPVPGAGAEVEITSPGKDGFGLFINETMPVAAAIKGKKPELGVTIRWSATMGSYLDPYVAEAVFVNCDYSDNLPDHVELIARAWVKDTLISSAQVSSRAAKGGAALPVRREGWIPAAVVGPAASPATPTTEPAVTPQMEAEAYDANWKGVLDDLPKEHAAEFMHELYYVDHGEDRDARAAHLRKALDLLPRAGTAIVLEFRLATMLGQNEDLEHKQLAKPAEAEKVLEHVIATYDHAAYFRDDPRGDSDSPDVMVPRAAIVAASYYTAIAPDAAQARKYADLALEKIDWSFRKRTADWENAPKPDAAASPFFGPFRDPQALITAWEKRKADAEAGKAVGPYDAEIAAAAVGVYARAHGEQNEASVAALRQVVEKYPKSPLSAAAEAELGRMQPASKLP